MLRGESRASTDEEYDAAIRRVGVRLRPTEVEFGKARARAAERYEDLCDLPVGRRLTILRNSPPELLLVFFHDLIGRSFDERFGDVKRSLELAELAIDVLAEVEKSGWLTPPDLEDLRAKAYAFLGNARRINSDVIGAERALVRAERHRARGTGDRAVEADLVGLLAALRVIQSRRDEATRLIDREIALRRLLGDPERLGRTLVERGWVVFFEASVEEICTFFNEGVALLTEPRSVLQALHALAERLAREGQGLDAWAALSAARNPLRVLENPRFELQHLWIKGLTHRALGDLEAAAEEISTVYDGLVEEEAGLRLAVAALDLACIRIAQGRFREVRKLIREAYEICVANGLERRAIAALLLLREAEEAAQLTEAMAVEAVSFLVRFQHNKARRFSWPGTAPALVAGDAEPQT